MHFILWVEWYEFNVQLSFTFTPGLMGFPGLVLPAFDKGDILSVKWITADSYFCSLCVGFSS